MAVIDTIAGLEGVLGKTPPPMHLKVIDHLDEGGLGWISKSPLAFAAAGDGASIQVTPAGGAPGFAKAEPQRLYLSLDSLDDPAVLREGLGFGSLFLLPGIGETLRVNGRVAEVRDGVAVIAVEECYGHCAKALIRSDFWGAEALSEAPLDAAAFVPAGRFLALATIDPQGRADLSPKGDPEGATALLDDAGDLWFAERPGNRRADSLRNIVVQSAMAGLLIIPGSTRVARLIGRATVTTDDAMRKRFAVRDKLPALVTGVADAVIEIGESAALARAALWPITRPTEGIDPPALFLNHIKLNRDMSLTARVAGAVFSIPGMSGMMRKGLEKDYRDNLY